MILCAVFDKEISKIIQPYVVEQVYTIDVRLESGRNKILVFTGGEGNLLIDEIPEEHNPVVKGAGAF